MPAWLSVDTSALGQGTSDLADSGSGASAGRSERGLELLRRVLAGSGIDPGRASDGTGLDDSGPDAGSGPGGEPDSLRHVIRLPARGKSVGEGKSVDQV